MSTRKIKVVGLTGAHCTGKTTTALAFVKQRKDYMFLKTSVGSVFDKHGIKPNDTLSIEARLNLQIDILATVKNYLEEARMGEVNVILDRTPLDMAAYTLAEVNQSSGGELMKDTNLNDKLCKYLDECIEVTNAYFNRIIAFSPVIPLVPDEAANRAAVSRSYVMHIDMLLHGIIQQSPLRTSVKSIPLSMMAIEERVRFISELT